VLPDGRFSDDQKWWWDGKQWMSVNSDDGHWRWDGVAWQPVESLAAAAAATAPGSSAANGFLRQIPGFRTMTPWKIVLACTGYGLAAFWLLAAVGIKALYDRLLPKAKEMREPANEVLDTAKNSSRGSPRAASRSVSSSRRSTGHPMSPILASAHETSPHAGDGQRGPQRSCCTQAEYSTQEAPP